MPKPFSDSKHPQNHTSLGKHHKSAKLPQSYILVFLVETYRSWITSDDDQLRQDEKNICKKTKSREEWEGREDLGEEWNGENEE